MPEIQIDVEALRQHLDLLGKGPDTRYRAIDPGKKRGAVKSVLSIDRVADCVKRGFDSYIVIGEGGDTDADITGIPAAFGEYDTGSIEWQIGAWRECGLPEPTFQVFTGNKSIHHCWKFLEPCPPDLWIEIQKRLIAQAGFDPTLCNPSRVLRLAGCPHQKTGELARIVNVSGYIYDADDFYARLDPVPQIVRPLTKEKYGERTIEEIFDALQCIPPRPGAGSGTYPKYRGILWGLRHALEEAGDSDPLETSIALMEAHSPDGWNVRQVAESGGDKVGAGTFWYHAKEAGYRFPKATTNLDRLRDALTQQVVEGAAEATSDWDLIESGFTQGAQGGLVLSQARPEDLALLVARDMRGVLWFDQMRNDIWLRDKPLDMSDYNLMYMTLGRRGYKIGKDAARDAVLSAARFNGRHPLQDYLRGLTVALPDGDWERIAEVTLGPGMGDFENITLQRWLVSAVARAFKPGAPFGHVHILAGPQKFGKTRYFNGLASDRWFLDGFLKTSNDTDDLIALHQSWVAELGEVDGGISRHNCSALKAFISRKTDVLRRPYSPSHEVCPRGFVLCGTTNKTTGFFVDDSGNRRFVVANILQPIDSEKVERLRDQIWGSAVRAYEAGMSWYLTPEEEEENGARNRGLHQGDPWSAEVERLLRADYRHSYGFLDAQGRYIVQTEPLIKAIEPELSRHNSTHQTRMRGILHALGFTQVRARSASDIPKKEGRQTNPRHGHYSEDFQ